MPKIFPLCVVLMLFSRTNVTIPTNNSLETKAPRTNLSFVGFNRSSKVSLENFDFCAFAKKLAVPCGTVHRAVCNGKF
jgi:hypothetical protein